MHQFLFSIFSLVCGENPDHLWAPGNVALPCCQRCTGLYVGALVAVVLHLCLKPRATIRWFSIHALFLLQLGLFVFPWIPQSPVLRTVSGNLFGFGVVAFLWPAVAKQVTKMNVTMPHLGALQRSGICNNTTRNEKAARPLFPLLACPAIASERRRRERAGVRASIVSNICDTYNADPFSFATTLYTFGLASCLVLTSIICKCGGTLGAYVLTTMILAGALALAALACANLVRCIYGLSPFVFSRFRAKIVS